MKFLEGTDIYLRALTDEDMDFILSSYNAPAVRALTGEVRPFGYSEGDMVINQRSDERVWFGMVEKETETLIGEAGLSKISREWGGAELSIVIPDPDKQSKGYGKEALTLLLGYAFGTLRLHRVYVTVADFNTRALAFFEKNGFLREGVQQEAYYYDFQYRDLIMLRLLDREFRR